jgi:hypothetical protein
MSNEQFADYINDFRQRQTPGDQPFALTEGQKVSLFAVVAAVVIAAFAACPVAISASRAASPQLCP